jgi:hypothetical protein
VRQLDSLGNYEIQLPGFPIFFIDDQSTFAVGGVNSKLRVLLEAEERRPTQLGIRNLEYSISQIQALNTGVIFFDCYGRLLQILQPPVSNITVDRPRVEVIPQIEVVHVVLDVPTSLKGDSIHDTIEKVPIVEEIPIVEDVSIGKAPATDTDVNDHTLISDESIAADTNVESARGEIENVDEIIKTNASSDVENHESADRDSASQDAANPLTDKPLAEHIDGIDSLPDGVNGDKEISSTTKNDVDDEEQCNAAQQKLKRLKIFIFVLGTVTIVAASIFVSLIISQHISFVTGIATGNLNCILPFCATLLPLIITGVLVIYFLFLRNQRIIIRPIVNNYFAIA